MFRYNKVIANDYKSEEIIKMIREWTELSQSDFGKSVGRTRDSINNFEHGKNCMTLDEFIYICKKHHVIVILEKR